MPVNKQLDIVCQMVHSDPKLANGFHLVGFSQGGLFVRALAQRCPPARLGSVISIGGPQQGVFGLPFCPNATALPLCQFIRWFLSKTAYTDFVQSRCLCFFPSEPTDSLCLRLTINLIKYNISFGPFNSVKFIRFTHFSRSFA